MSTLTADAPRSAAATLPPSGVIDACVFHEWGGRPADIVRAEGEPEVQALAEYLPDGWRDLLTQPGVTVAGTPTYPDPAPPDGAGPITDHERLAATVLDTGELARLVLSYRTSVLATTHPNQFVAHVMAEAANRWTEERWLARDRRVHGLVATSCAMPDVAAKEIRRSGAHPQMVGVLLGAPVLGTPLGHPVYHPIYEAAAELELPVIVQEGFGATQNTITPPVSGGKPATGGEYRAFAWHQQVAQVASMIVQGVFDRFPRLKVLVLGAGAVWLPGQLWRLDTRFGQSLGDARWLKRRPLDYAEHVWTATWRLEDAPSAEVLAQAVSGLPGFEERLVYASGTPTRDALDVPALAARIPQAWHRGVLGENALKLFRWPGATPAATREANADV